MKPTDEAKRLQDEIYHVYAFTTEGELSCTDATHAIDADDLPAIINKVLDAAISVAESERLTEETGDPSDTAYESAIDCVTLAINKLRP